MLFETISSTPQPAIGFITGVPGPVELIVVALVILLLFGKRLPDLMGSLGRSIVEFKKGAREVEGPVSNDSEQNQDAES